jgi:hypothetical protein
MVWRVNRFAALVVFPSLAILSTAFLWSVGGWRVLLQGLAILIIATIGENLISSKGYYHYTRQDLNGPFIRNVPAWIPFLWIMVIQSSFLLGYAAGMSDIHACIFSGLIAMAVDLMLLEPWLSRRRELWVWTPVRGGYFDFIPPELNRFTAPPGNYIVWLAFPILLNYGLVVSALLFP